MESDRRASIIQLNKARPKNCFPLLVIDQLVGGTARHVSFMGAYSGYNQIAMHVQIKSTQVSSLIQECITTR